MAQQDLLKALTDVDGEIARLQKLSAALKTVLNVFFAEASAPPAETPSKASGAVPTPPSPRTAKRGSAPDSEAGETDVVTTLRQAPGPLTIAEILKRLPSRARCDGRTLAAQLRKMPMVVIVNTGKVPTYRLTSVTSAKVLTMAPQRTISLGDKTA